MTRYNHAIDVVHKSELSVVLPNNPNFFSPPRTVPLTVHLQHLLNTLKEIAYASWKSTALTRRCSTKPFDNLMTEMRQTDQTLETLYSQLAECHTSMLKCQSGRIDLLKQYGSLERGATGYILTVEKNLQGKWRLYPVGIWLSVIGIER
jgi:hypothetical protein